MQWRNVRAGLLFLLVLQMLHLPLPCPDLDGECRGTPILSLADANAWHTLLLGVRPNDDVDRGPFRNDRSEGRKTPSDSPYDDLALTSDNVCSLSVRCGSDNEEWQITCCAATVQFPVYPSFASSQNFRFDEVSWTLDARILRACACIWRI